MQRSELEHLKSNARVWERKTSLYFLSTKEDAMKSTEDALKRAKERDDDDTTEQLANEFSQQLRQT